MEVTKELRDRIQGLITKYAEQTGLPEPCGVEYDVDIYDNMCSVTLSLDPTDDTVALNVPRFKEDKCVREAVGRAMLLRRFPLNTALRSSSKTDREEQLERGRMFGPPTYKRVIDDEDVRQGMVSFTLGEGGFHDAS